MKCLDNDNKKTEIEKQLTWLQPTDRIYPYLQPQIFTPGEYLMGHQGFLFHQRAREWRQQQVLEKQSMHQLIEIGSSNSYDENLAAINLVNLSQYTPLVPQVMKVSSLITENIQRPLNPVSKQLESGEIYVPQVLNLSWDFHRYHAILKHMYSKRTRCVKACDIG